jgi:Type IV secretory pathway, VirB6 components
MFYEQLFQTIGNTISSAINSNVSGFMDFMNPVFRSMLVIYVAWWGIAHIMGLQSDLLRESFFRTFKIAVILTIALNVGVYNDLVRDTLVDGPESLAKIFTGTDSSSLDTVFDKGIEVGMTAWNEAGLSDMGLYFVAIFIFGATIAVTAYAAFLLLLSQLAISILVGCGPAFICLTIFESTKKYFEAWMGQCMNFFLLYVITFAALSLFMGAYETFVNSMTADGSALDTVAYLVVFSLCFVLILRQVPAIASALGGGTQLSTLGGFGGMISRVGGLRPTNIRRNVQMAKRDAKIVGNAGKWIGNKVSAPFRRRSNAAS